VRQNPKPSIINRAVEHGVPLEAKVSEAAAAAGNLEALQVLRAGGCPLDENAVRAASRNGHAEVVAWLRANG
jgi:hypothetical protein